MKRNTPNFTSGQFSVLRRGAHLATATGVETQSQARKFTVELALTTGSRPFVNSVELEIPKRLRPVFGDIEGVLSGAMSLEEAGGYGNASSARAWHDLDLTYRFAWVGKDNKPVGKVLTICRSRPVSLGSGL
jgi:hypothetical protein